MEFRFMTRRGHHRSAPKTPMCRGSEAGSYSRLTYFVATPLCPYGIAYCVWGYNPVCKVTPVILHGGCIPE